MQDDLIAEIAKALRAYFCDHTGFYTEEDEGAVTACYGGHWISIDTNALATAAHSVMAGKVAELEVEVARLRAAFTRAKDRIRP